VLHEELARHIRAAAEDVGADEPDYAALADIEAERLIATLPGGWAEGDDPSWEPA